MKTDVASKSSTEYILFTGLPGGGKSSTIKGLKRKLETDGKTVVFRDEIMSTYSARQLYWYTISKISPQKLFSLTLFWWRYPIQKDGGSRSWIWNKKLALWKRMVLAHVIVAIEKPDYFIDETIEAQYRCIDEAYETKTVNQWSLYPGSQLHMVVIDTPIEVAAKRQVMREVEDETEQDEALATRLTNREWFQTMKDNIAAATALLQGTPRTQLITVDGTEEISKNVEIIYHRLGSFARSVEAFDQAV